MGLALDIDCTPDNEHNMQQPSANLVPSSLSSPTAASEPGQQQQQQQSQSQEPQQQFQQERQWQLVKVDNQGNKSSVGVHVPIFFNMLNQNDKDSGKERLDLSVLQGLVTVNKDKERNQNGEMTGPVKVTVFGIPVYSSKGTGSSAGSRLGQEAAATEVRKSSAGSGASAPAATTEATSAIVNRVQEVNERVLSSLSSLLERFSQTLKRASNNGGSLAGKTSDPLQAAGQTAQTNEVIPVGMTKLMDDSKQDRGRAL